MATVQEVNLEPEVDLDLIYSTPANGAHPAAPADDGLGALGAFACCGGDARDACDAPCADDSAVLDDWDLAPAKDDEELLRRIWDDLNDEALRRVWRETGGDEAASASERKEGLISLFLCGELGLLVPDPASPPAALDASAAARQPRGEGPNDDAASPLLVTVPRGAEPGRSLRVRLSDGRALKVTVPKGAEPGAQLAVDVRQAQVSPELRRVESPVYSVLIPPTTPPKPAPRADLA
jgi:hypothetical protein